METSSFEKDELSAHLSILRSVTIRGLIAQPLEDPLRRMKRL